MKKMIKGIFIPLVVSMICGYVSAKLVYKVYGDKVNNRLESSKLYLIEDFDDLDYDLIVEKNGIISTVQCKATGSADNAISLRSTGGTKGKVYDNVLEHPVDYLFCLDGSMNMYVIPVSEMKEYGCNRQITLRTQKTINGQGFQTYKYQVFL